MYQLPFGIPLPKLKGVDCIHPLAVSYSEANTSPDEALLARVQDETSLRHPEAHMMSSRVQGRLLSMLSRMVRPERILEIGTFTGYSALCLAEGLRDDGLLHTLEIRERDARQAEMYFEQSMWRKQIRLHVGEALPLIETLNENWDLVFLDADKINYVHYYEAVLPRMRSGGWLIADNVLFHGEVLQKPIKGKNARAIDAFNQCVRDDDRTEQVMLTIRDGLMLIQKK